MLYELCQVSDLFIKLATGLQQRSFGWPVGLVGFGVVLLGIMGVYGVW